MAAHGAAHDAGHDALHDPGAAHNGFAVATTPPQAEPLADSAQGVSLPAWSTRGSAPGPRGCWALNKHGDPCGSARRAEGDYCNAHSGLGVAEDPAKWAAVGSSKAVENRRRRAMLRTTLGITRSSTPRGVLKALAYVEAERIAGRVVGAVLDPAVPSATAARLGLDLLQAVDPPVEATLTASIPTTPEGVADLSLTQLLTLGEQMGIPLPSPSPNGSVEP